MLREILEKNDFIGMAFVGVRGDESLARSKYEYVTYGGKHKGQYSCNVILEWNSAEIFNYIYEHNLYMNKTYLKGNRRAGCLVCPRAAGRNDFMNHHCYPDEADKFLNIIKEQYDENFKDKGKLGQFMAAGGWKARKNGRDLALKVNYEEKKTKDNNLKISVNNPKADWKIWIKTIGILMTDTSPYKILFQGEEYEFKVIGSDNEYEVIVDNDVLKKKPLFGKYLKNVFRKATCCVGCRECEADCHNGCLKITNGNVTVSDNCKHCAQCHKVDKGCLVYKSLEMPKGGLIMNNSKNQSLNCYSHHAPKMEWFTQYFKYKEDFAEKHDLGSQMFNFFKRFLRDAGLLDAKGFTNTAEVVDRIGLNNNAAWGIMLANLAYTPQIHWYIKRVIMGETVSKEYLVSLLLDDGAKENWAPDIWASLVRILALPFGNIGLGYVGFEKKKAVSMTRTTCDDPEQKVILYSLYKFAEACGDYYQFTLSRLMNFNVDSDGLSPAQIFGLNNDSMKKILNGLSTNYPEFISASFTLDLDNITLRSDKTSKDVLELF